MTDSVCVNLCLHIAECIVRKILSTEDSVMFTQSRFSFFVFIAFLVVVSASGAKEMYKSVGPDGKIIYSDRVSADAKLEKKIVLKDLPASEVSAETAAAIERMKQQSGQSSSASQRADTVLYTTSWCGYCRKARAYLAGKNIPYREVDIETDSGLSAYVQAGGTQGVPYLVAKGQTVMGFDAEEYDLLFGRP